MEARDSHRLANKLDSRESDTDSQGGPRMVRVAESVMVTRNSHRLANEPDSRESDTEDWIPHLRVHQHSLYVPRVGKQIN